MGKMWTAQRPISAVFVSDLLSNKDRKVVMATVPNTATVKTAARILEDHKTGALMVVNFENRPVGIITSRDIQRAVANYDIPNLSFCKTTDVMTTKENLSFASPHDSVHSVATLMKSRNIRHLPVINEKFEFVAMLSFKDVITEVLKYDADEKVKKQSGR